MNFDDQNSLYSSAVIANHNDHNKPQAGGANARAEMHVGQHGEIETVECGREARQRHLGVVDYTR